MAEIVERLLNQKEVSEMIGCTESFMEQNRFRRGTDTIPFHKVGRNVRYRRQDVEQWIEQRRVCGGQKTQHR